LQSTPESGARAGYDGAKRRKGSKVHIAIDTLGHLLALKVTAADQGDRAKITGVTNVVLDHDRAAKVALRHLYDLGHRLIAFMKRQPLDQRF
jgi:DNA-binding LacI/PurR family transcriptional regulator